MTAPAPRARGGPAPVTRPIVRYHGGKWILAPWLLTFFPPHRTYVEAFGGGGSVLMRKPRCHGEVYNDLDGEIVNVFRVLRDPVTSEQLRRAVELTPYARAEYDVAWRPDADPVEQARRTIARAFMGFGSASTSGRYTGFRASAKQSNTTPATDWRHYAGEVPGFTERLRGVVIEHRDAIEVLRHHDAPGTLFYIDPPYVAATRDGGRDYRHEYTDADHRALAAVLHTLAGMVILSGYACELYDRELFADWTRHERATYADGGRDRTEVVWLNPACAAALAAAHPQLSLSALLEDRSHGGPADAGVS